MLAQVRGFTDAWDFWVNYQESHNKVVSYDTQPVFILGDIAVNKDWLEMMCGQLRGKLHLANECLH